MFVNVVASIQYRALADKANEAFYKLSNTRSQIQAYVFDGINQHILLHILEIRLFIWNVSSMSKICLMNT